MPVPAADEAEVFAGDADPLEVLGGGEHPLDELAVGVLDPAPLDQRRPGLGDAVGEAVAQRLQLAEAEDPRRGGEGLDPVRHLGVAEGLSEEARQLSLEAADLLAQLQAGVALVDSDPEPGELLFSQQSGHPEKCRSGGLQRRRSHPQRLLDGDLGDAPDLDRGDGDAAAVALDSVALGGGAEEEPERPHPVSDRQR
ncbi:MAG TPA: hypothetical protein VK480_08415, partial [Solirubrobacterales bacterium]|nr:hypothetical protein [Solirubrobacterales bacterium]